MSTRLEFDLLAKDRASRTFNNVGDSAHRSGGKVRAFSKVMGTAALGLAAGGVAVGAGLFKLAQGAAEDEKAAKSLAVTLKNNTGATDAQVAKNEQWISSMGVAYGVADDDLRPALSKLAVATKDVGESHRLASLAMNVSAGTGKSLEVVTTALAKAQGGSLTALNKLSPGLVDTKDKTATLESATARLSHQFQGQASAAANTTAGKYERLKLQLSEAGEAIGYKLLPYGLKLADFMLQKGIPFAEKFASAAKDKLGQAIHYVTGLFGDSTTKAGGLGDAMDDGRKIVGNLKRAWDGLSPLLDTAARTILPLMIDNFKRTVHIIADVSDAAIWLYNKALGPSLKLSTAAFAKLLEGIGDTLDLLASVPGAPKWIKKTADGAHDAADKVQGISDAIHEIPDRKEVQINVKYTQARATRGQREAGELPATHTPKPVAAEHSLRQAVDSVKKLAGGGFKVNLGPAGTALMGSLVDGIRKGKKPLGDALKTVRDQLQQQTQQIADAVAAARQGLADARAGVVDDFKGWQTSIFAATSQDDQPFTVDGLLAYAQNEAAKAASVNEAVTKLSAPGGLSASLLHQLQNSGSSGYDTLRLLASADPSQVAEFNRLNAQTETDYGAAGTSVADQFYGQGTSQEELTLAQAQTQSVALLQGILDALQDLGGVSDAPLELKLSDTGLVATQKKRKRDRGRK